MLLFYNISHYFKNIFIITILNILLFLPIAQALDLEDRDYFASIKSSKANIRSGPGINYHIKFTYNMRYVPIRVTGKYDNWSEIEDFQGERGWINNSLLSKKRTVIVKSKKSLVNLYSAPTNKSRILLKLENKVIMKLFGCKDEWCKTKVKGKKGWIKKKEIWGAK